MTEAAPRRGVFGRVVLFAVVLLVVAGAAALGGYLVYDHVTRPGTAGEALEPGR